MPQPDGVERRRRQIGGIGAPGKFQRHGNILQRRHRRDQAERLKDDADIVTAQRRKGVFAHAGDLPSGKIDAAVTETLKSGHDHQQAGLAGTAGAKNADRLAGFDVQCDAAKDFDHPLGAGQRQTRVAKGDDRVARGGFRRWIFWHRLESFPLVGLRRAAAPAAGPFIWTWRDPVPRLVTRSARQAVETPGAAATVRRIWW